MFFFFVFIVYQSDICTSYFASAIPLPESEDSSGTVKRTLYVQTHQICIYVEAHVPPGTCRGYMNEQNLKDIFESHVYETVHYDRILEDPNPMKVL